MPRLGLRMKWFDSTRSLVNRPRWSDKALTPMLISRQILEQRRKTTLKGHAHAYCWLCYGPPWRLSLWWSSYEPLFQRAFGKVRPLDVLYSANSDRQSTPESFLTGDRSDDLTFPCICSTPLTMPLDDHGVHTVLNENNQVVEYSTRHQLDVQRFSQLPTNLSPYLQVLDLTNSRYLTVLDESIGRFAQLQVLRLSHCWRLMRLPDVLPNSLREAST